MRQNKIDTIQNIKVVTGGHTSSNIVYLSV